MQDNTATSKVNDENTELSIGSAVITTWSILLALKLIGVLEICWGWQFAAFIPISVIHTSIHLLIFSYNTKISSCHEEKKQLIHR